MDIYKEVSISTFIIPNKKKKQMAILKFHSHFKLVNWFRKIYQVHLRILQNLRKAFHEYLVIATEIYWGEISNYVALINKK